MLSLANPIPILSSLYSRPFQTFAQTKNIPKDAAGLIGKAGQEGAGQDERTGAAEVCGVHVIRMTIFKICNTGQYI